MSMIDIPDKKWDKEYRHSGQDVRLISGTGKNQWNRSKRSQNSTEQEMNNKPTEASQQQITSTKTGKEREQDRYYMYYAMASVGG